MNSLKSEVALLGSMIIDPTIIGEVNITEDAFTAFENRTIFMALKTLEGQEVDLVILRDKLIKINKLDDIGGIEYLVSIGESVPSAANFKHYCDIVKNWQYCREVNVAAERTIESCKNGEPVTDLIDKINMPSDGNVQLISESLIETVENIEGRKTGIHGVPTGFIELDNLLHGLRGGQFIIIAARPSMGKTTFALNIAEHISITEKMPVLFFSMEMAKSELVEKILNSQSGVGNDITMAGNISDKDIIAINEAAVAIQHSPLLLSDKCELTPQAIKAETRKAIKSHGIKAVIIDYLQLMTLSKTLGSKYADVSEISRSLKVMARDLDIPVITLCQLNRAANARSSHRPMMSDLRDSGSLEQDADVVLMLHRESYYHKGDKDYDWDSPEARVTDVIIEKQRNGSNSSVGLDFDGDKSRFISRRWDY